jgi:hypothetical protein
MLELRDDVTYLYLFHDPDFSKIVHWRKKISHFVEEPAFHKGMSKGDWDLIIYGVGKMNPSVNGTGILIKPLRPTPRPRT